MNYWLFKSEPSEFFWEDLKKSKKQMSEKSSLLEIVAEKISTTIKNRFPL